MSNLHPIMQEALRPWILPPATDPRHALLLERDDDPEPVQTVYSAPEGDLCGTCNGSGEGRYSGTCYRCKGSGEVFEE
ncbi:MAG: hypothetical protein KGL39_16880 [Patescibacteria group bacterium]|nr:hypothetical protein [Patescibacteria group bacterium]